MKKCRYCGAQLQDSAKFCTSCGRKYVDDCTQTCNTQYSQNTTVQRIERPRKKLKALTLIITIVVLAFVGEAVFAHWWYTQPKTVEKEMIVNPTKSVEETTKVDPYQEASAYCDELISGDDYLQVVPYLEQLCQTDDSRYQVLWAKYEQLVQKRVLNEAAEYAQNDQYKEAAYFILDAQSIYDCTAFQTRIAEYRSHLTIPLSKCAVVEDSNFPGGKTPDVCSGNWEDVFGTRHPNSIRFWVVQKAGWNNTEYIVYQLNRKYVSLTGQIITCSDSDMNSNAAIEIYLDDELVYSSPTISKKTGAISFEIDVSNADQIKIVCKTDEPYFNYCIVDAEVSEV